MFQNFGELVLIHQKGMYVCSYSPKVMTVLMNLFVKLISLLICRTTKYLSFTLINIAIMLLYCYGNL